MAVPAPLPGAVMKRPRAGDDRLRIDVVAVPGGGELGLTICPGRYLEGLPGRGWQRDLQADLDVICAWPAATMLTLMEAPELAMFGVAQIGSAVSDRGLAWHHLPIIDMEAPDARFEARWPACREALAPVLAADGRVLIHCLGGLGRSGTVAARILMEAGMDAATAIRQVRRARPGAIQTASQLRYLLERQV